MRWKGKNCNSENSCPGVHNRSGLSAIIVQNPGERLKLLVGSPILTKFILPDNQSLISIYPSKAGYLALPSTFLYSLCNRADQTGCMNLDNTQVQMRKGILEYCILHIIARGEVYASDMLDELTAAKIIVVEGTLYPLLTRLKNAGLLEYKWIESKSGPPRKYYKLTDKGSKFLTRLTETWDELVHSTQMITSKSKAL